MKNNVCQKFLVLMIGLFTLSSFQMKAEDWQNWNKFPTGFTPEEVGAKLGRHFIPGKHLLHGGKWIHYAEVCTWLGALRFAETTNDVELINLLQMRFEPLFNGEKHYQPIKNHVDLNMFGCLPLEFYLLTKEPKYFTLGMPYADTQWELPVDASPEEKANADKGLSWQTRLWIDDMFMITIVQSQAYRVTGDRKYIDRAAKEMVYYLNELQRPNGLFYHAPDVPFFWARGNGWMAAGMAELLKALPVDSPERPDILKGYIRMMESLKKYQGADGMWKQLVDQMDCWPETSGSAMFAYAIILGVKHGWLDKDTYAPIARKAWLGIVPYINENGDVREVCIGTNKLNNKQYYYDRPRITGDYHGQAPVLWCAAALLEEKSADTRTIFRKVKINNNRNTEKIDEPIVLNIRDLCSTPDIKSVIVTDGDREIPSQLDDIDGDGRLDELAFVLNVPARSQKNLEIALSTEKKNRKYTPRVYAEMLIRDCNNKHVPIHSLTIPGTSNTYNQLHHHGPAFESELVAYRIYFDKKQTVDIYGKFHKQLEIAESRFYPTDEQLAKGFGDDVLMVGESCGLGTLKGWDGKKAIHIGEVESLTESIIASGPVRTVIDVIANNWNYQGGQLTSRVRYILYAGHRDCKVQVSFNRPLRRELFATGVEKIKDGDMFSDHKGLVASWGTDWPVNDTVKYAKETVGLAVNLPANLIQQEVADTYNYLYTIGAENQLTFSYHIMFTSRKETFGYKSKDDWFAYTRQWKENLSQPCRVEILDR